MRVVYIDIDSLRPDHLGCYGYHRQTSPNIDALASEGVRFDNYYASDTPCLPSRTAFFTGQFGTVSGVVNHGGKFADLAPRENRGFRSREGMGALGACLSKAGVHTCSISDFPNRHTAYQAWFGFREVHDTGRAGGCRADHIWPMVEEWLAANGERDGWFLHMNMWDPHTPYDTPPEFGDPFREEDIEPWITDQVIADQNKSFGPHSAAEVPDFDDRLPPYWRMGVGSIKSRADAKTHMDGYDTGIAFADHYVGKLVDMLGRLGVRDETAFIITADHGESQGEHNVWGDHQLASQSVHHLPLVMVWPGWTDDKKGASVGALHYHVDLARTIVEWLGGTVPDWHCGQRMGLGEDGGRPYLVLSHGAWSCQRSVRWGRWLFTRTYHAGLKDVPKWGLYDLEADPHETTNLAPSHPVQMAEALQMLDEWTGSIMPLAPRGDPLWGVIQEGGPYHANKFSPEWAMYLKRLRETGRAHHADALAVAQGAPLRDY